MGIEGLLQLFKPMVQQEHISSFQGTRVGIDAFPWLYKGCYMHYSTLDLENADSITPSCSNYLLQMLDTMAFYSITPYFVFDGRSLPMKKDTIAKRKQARDSNQDKFQDLKAKKEWDEARKILTRTIRVTEEILCEAITVLKLKNIQFIISPYETDSQLSKLWVDAKIDYVITEDSDFIVYGCKKIIYKISEEGDCDYLDLSRPSDNMDSAYLKSFLSLSKQSQILVCVMAGCDYVPSIKGVGLKKAMKYVEKYGEIEAVVRQMKQETAWNERIPSDYIQKVKNACLIFQHALIFNSQHSQFEHFSALPQDNSLTSEQISQLGDPYQDYIDKNVYGGDCQPRSLAPRAYNTTIHIQTHTKVNVLKLKELQQQARCKKQERARLQQQKEDMMDLNIIEAVCTLKKPVTVSEFWSNTMFKSLMDNSILAILSQR